MKQYIENQDQNITSDTIEDKNSALTNKLVYVKPKLITYGKVKNLTKGSGSEFFDENETPLF